MVLEWHKPKKSFFVNHLCLRIARPLVQRVGWRQVGSFKLLHNRNLWFHNFSLFHPTAAYIMRSSQILLFIIRSGNSWKFLYVFQKYFRLNAFKWNIHKYIKNLVSWNIFLRLVHIVKQRAFHRCLNFFKHWSLFTGRSVRKGCLPWAAFGMCTQISILNFFAF